MNSSLMFVLSIIITAVLAILFVFRTPSNAKSYFLTESGKKVLNGIVVFIVFGLFFALVFSNKASANEETGKFLAYGEVYLGMDYTGKISPQCYSDGPDNRLTSNGGLRVNIFQSHDKRFEFNTKYTHHSCAFNADRESYDAIGIEFSYRLW